MNDQNMMYYAGAPNTYYSTIPNTSDQLAVLADYCQANQLSPAKPANGYTYLVIKENGFVIGDIHTLYRYYHPQSGDKYEVYENIAVAQDAVYERIMINASNFTDSIPRYFPVNSLIEYRKPALNVALV